MKVISSETRPLCGSTDGKGKNKTEVYLACTSLPRFCVVQAFGRFKESITYISSAPPLVRFQAFGRHRVLCHRVAKSRKSRSAKDAPC